jgi:hypothetical protein
MVNERRGGRAEPDDGTSTILQYFPEERSIDSSAVGVYFIALPALVGIVIAAIGLPELAIPGVFAAAAVLWYRSRRAVSPHAVLEIEASRLRVTRGESELLLDVPLEELLDVSLDSKTIQRVQENAGHAMPELRFVDPVVGPPIEESRIVFETLDGSVLLNENFTSNIDATDWFGKIRRYLRKNGWVPEDER